jgi:hypothetical protein
MSAIQTETTCLPALVDATNEGRLSSIDRDHARHANRIQVVREMPFASHFVFQGDIRPMNEPDRLQRIAPFAKEGLLALPCGLLLLEFSRGDGRFIVHSRYNLVDDHIYVIPYYATEHDHSRWFAGCGVGRICPSSGPRLRIEFNFDGEETRFQQTRQSAVACAAQMVVSVLAEISQGGCEVRDVWPCAVLNAERRREGKCPISLFRAVSLRGAESAPAQV